MRKGQTKLKPGDVFGALTLVRFIGNVNGSSRWEASCQCGGRAVVCASNLTKKPENRATRTCADRTKHQGPNTRHGRSRTREYRAWKAMKKRVASKLPKVAKYYRDRGITVWPEWAASFEAFLSHIGPIPEGYRISVDRFPNNDGNYEPGNVRWANQKMQCNNKRSSGRKA